MEVELMVKTFDLTSNASFITYRIETLIKMKTSKKMIYNFVELEKKTGSFPPELEFVTGFYDEQTGSSGSLFRNTKLDNYILAYTGTNYYFEKRICMLMLWVFVLVRENIIHHVIDFTRE